MNKRVYLLHGWGGQPAGGFRPWLKKELEARGHFSGEDGIFEVPTVLQAIIS